MIFCLYIKRDIESPLYFIAYDLDREQVLSFRTSSQIVAMLPVGLREALRDPVFVNVPFGVYEEDVTFVSQLKEHMIVPVFHCLGALYYNRVCTNRWQYGNGLARDDSVSKLCPVWIIY